MYVSSCRQYGNSLLRVCCGLVSTDSNNLSLVPELAKIAKVDLRDRVLVSWQWSVDVVLVSECNSRSRYLM